MTTINPVVTQQPQMSFKGGKKNLSEILQKEISKDIKILDDSVFKPYSSLSTEGKKTSPRII